jgi:hypothetical protein
MGNMVYSEFESWNTSSVDFCVGHLIFRYDIIKYERTGEIVPISNQLYDYLQNKIDNFLVWYKTYKENNYKPSQGINKMYPYEIIYKTVLLNKKNHNLLKLYKFWNSRSPYTQNIIIDKKTVFRIEKKDLLDIPDDPMILIF